jgi:aurora kinase
MCRYQVEREIRIHIALDHENIIKLYAAFEDEKNVYMVQEFAGNGDLFEELRRNGGIVKEKYAVRDILAPFLNALSYMHSRNIVHRDIKPENLLLASNKMIKIADFGLSIDCSSERPVTRAGTLDYMVSTERLHPLLCAPSPDSFPLSLASGSRGAHLP